MSGAEITVEGIRNLLNPIVRRRHIVFCAVEDREKVAEVCRTLRGEGYEIVEKVHKWLPPGPAYCVDADFLQPGALIADQPRGNKR